MERRTYLALSATALAALTGCATGDSGGDATTTTQETTTTTQDTTTEATTEDTTTTTTTQETTEETTTTTTTATTTAAARESITVVVGPDQNFRFAPQTFRLVAGGTVTWEWDSRGHNVKPSSTPEGSDWSGTPGGAGETFSAGHTYEHTFDVAGEYGYYCAPHRSFDMVGSFAVE